MSILKKYSALMVPIDSKRINTFIESDKLVTLRDWLLPMLMNGQVSVADIEE
jgi:type I restriction enzyme S subunit